MSHIQKTFIKTALLSAVTGGALLLTGCVVAPHHRVYVPQVAVPAGTPSTNTTVEYVQSAPPPEYTEVITVSPGVGYVWLPGLWYWSSGRYTWRAGHWARPPAGYSSYHRGTWGHTPGRGWYHSGGGWR